MRLRTVNRLSLVAVSSALVTSLLGGGGCQHAPPPAHPVTPAPTLSRGPMMPRPASRQISQKGMMGAMASTVPVMPKPATEPMATAVTQPTTGAATEPVIQPASRPTTEPIIENAPAPTDQDIIDSDATLAERIAGIAELEFAVKVRNPAAWPAIWKHQAALLAACAALNPKEARFPRLQADAFAQIHDIPGEEKALGAAIFAQQASGSYQPDDFIWIRDLDLRLGDLQTATDKLAYLEGLVGAKEVPVNVRAHAMWCKAQILLARGEDQAVDKTLADAIELCPASLECLKMRYSLLAPGTTRLERCTQLLSLLQANPLQPEYSAELADLIADSGLVLESLPWFNLAVATLHLTGDPGYHTMLNLAAELYIADQKPDALRVDETLLKFDPSNTQAQFLRLVILRSMEDKKGYETAMQEATNAVSNRVVDAINSAAPTGTPKATTRPINDVTPLSLPDLGLTVAQLNQGGKPEHKAQFAEAVADMAMLSGYFGHQTDAAAQLIDQVKGVVPNDSPELARLQGWNDLLSGKPDDAKTKFAAVAVQDPLAELGMVKVLMADGNSQDHDSAEDMGRRLLQDHSSGLLGAILWEELHNQRVKLVPTTQAVTLQAPLAAFPTELMSLVDKPTSIYSIHVQPQVIGSYVGEPVLASVTFYNLTGHDLTIGPDGVLKPELLFKVNPQVGETPQSFDAFDTITGPTVLSGHSQFVQVIRLDQTQLLSFLNSKPGLAFQINGSLTVNQVMNQLGGFETQFVKPFFRQSAPLTPDKIKLFMTALTDGRSDQKITALSMVQMFVRGLRTLRNPPEGTDQQIASMLEAIHHSARTETLPAVAAWAKKCEAELVAPDKVEGIVRDLAEDADWRHRQMALLMLGSISPAMRDQLLEKLIVDPQACVRADARATKEIIALPTTMPASMPATMPTMSPATTSP